MKVSVEISLITEPGDPETGHMDLQALLSVAGAAAHKRAREIIDLALETKRPQRPPRAFVFTGRGDA